MIYSTLPTCCQTAFWWHQTKHVTVGALVGAADWLVWQAVDASCATTMAA